MKESSWRVHMSLNREHKFVIWRSPPEIKKIPSICWAELCAYFFVTGTAALAQVPASQLSSRLWERETHRWGSSPARISGWRSRAGVAVGPRAGPSSAPCCRVPRSIAECRRRWCRCMTRRPCALGIQKGSNKRIRPFFSQVYIQKGDYRFMWL